MKTLIAIALLLSSGTTYADFFSCNPIVGGPFEMSPGKIFKFEFVLGDGQEILSVGAVKNITVTDGKLNPFPEVEKTMSAEVKNIVKVDEVPGGPVPRGGVAFTRITFAVKAELESTTYDIGWADGGDYRYPSKKIEAYLFCTQIHELSPTEN